MYIEGVLFKNTFGPLNTFRMRIAHTPHLMLDRRGEIVDLLKRLNFLTNKEGGPLGDQGHWYYNGEKVGASLMETVRWLVQNPEIAISLETAIQNHLVETTSFMPLVKAKAAAKPKAAPKGKGKRKPTPVVADDEEGEA